MKKKSNFSLGEDTRKQIKKKEKQPDSSYEDELQDLLKKLGVKSGRSRFCILCQQLGSLIGILLILSTFLLAFSESARIKLWNFFFQGLTSIHVEIAKPPEQSPTKEAVRTSSPNQLKETSSPSFQNANADFHSEPRIAFHKEILFQKIENGKVFIDSLPFPPPPVSAPTDCRLSAYGYTSI